MTVNIRTLKHGDKVRARFHGSAIYGNEPYEMTLMFSEYKPESDSATFFADMQMTDVVEVYFVKNRWRYGTSAEPFTVKEKILS